MEAFTSLYLHLSRGNIVYIQFLSILTIFSVSLNLSAQDFGIQENGRWTKIELFKHDNAWMNEACYINKNKCLYYLPLREDYDAKSLINYSSDKFCLDHQGELLEVNFPGKYNSVHSLYLCSIKNRTYLFSLQGLALKKNRDFYMQQENNKRNKHFYIQRDNKQLKVELFKHDNAWMNETCYSNQDECLYYLPLPEHYDATSHVNIYTAFNNYCRQLSGELLDVKDNEDYSYELCSFKNGTYLIGNQALYSKRNFGLHEHRGNFCELENDKISLSFKKIKLTDVFQLIADYRGLKLDIDKSLSLLTTPVDLKCIPWTEITINLSKKYNLNVNIVGSTMQVKQYPETPNF